MAAVEVLENVGGDGFAVFAGIVLRHGFCILLSILNPLGRLEHARHGDAMVLGEVF